ncbi:hypothetical protein AZA_14786 [Nitrospirillum viridazoti Y2]|nr:hypothetical protein AZA_14786 [Nitrospirillum amazonense Y2]
MPGSYVVHVRHLNQMPRQGRRSNEIRYAQAGCLGSTFDVIVLFRREPNREPAT